MRVNAVNFAGNISGLRNIKPFAKRQVLQTDTVSFSGKYYNSAVSSKNVQAASVVGKNIYKQLNAGISKKQIFNEIEKKNSLLTVRPIEELRTFIMNPQDYQAYYSYHLGNDFEPENARLYVNLNLPSNNRNLNLSFAMDTAHEFTHFQQTKNGDDKKFMQELSNNDVKYAGFITAIGDKVFVPLDTVIQAEMAKGAFDMQDAINMVMNNGKIVPRAKDVSKRQLFTSDNLPKNEEDFKDYIQCVLIDNFQKVMKMLIYHPELADEEVYNMGIDILSDKEKEMKFVDDIRKYCQYHAKQEREAYTTESEVAKSALGTGQMLNIDIFPMYYEMLYNALNQPFA